MDERVWEKTAQFLKELRCEDTGRLSQLQLPEYQKAMKEKFEYSRAMKSHFRKFGNQMSGSGNHLCNYASLLA